MTAQARTLARAPLTWRERRQACGIADFLRRRRGQGYSETTLRAQITQIWPAATPPILAAAELFYEARADGWPET
jgi:hypothetical protein